MKADDDVTLPEAPRRKQGFASMTPEKRKQVAAAGGRAAQRNGKAHRFTSEEASVAGKKGGRVSHERGEGHRFTSEEARRVGYQGAAARCPPHRRADILRRHEEGWADEAIATALKVTAEYVRAVIEKHG